MMKKTTRNYIWALAANGLLLLAVVALWQFKLHVPSVQQDPDERYLPGATYLENLTKETNLSEIKGQWTLVNLWAAWCPSCITEMPSLEKIANEYKSKGLRVIAISLDEAKSADEIEKHIAKFKFGPLARNWDNKGQVYAKLNPEGLPMTYLLDPSGKIIKIFAGERDWTSPDTRALLDTYVK